MSPPSPLPRLVGRYALYGAIASGGMATVHFGRLLGPVGFSRTVAIKRLHAQFAADPDFAGMFLDEARMVARIRHPNVVPTLDIIADQGELFLVMEYVSGESLARLLHTMGERRERMPLPLVANIICGALQGLHAAHEAKDERGQPMHLVHRDVSPHNLHVGIDGVTRVIDFGVAKAAGRIQTTRDGQIKGKLAYMPPEQLRGGDVTRTSDVYAAGICLWEMLTGRRLFEADNEGAVISKILSGDVEPPSHYLTRNDPNSRAALLTSRVDLVALDQCVLRALASDPEDRYPTARDMARAIERAVPLGSTSDVGDFVERNAITILQKRANTVAEIESSSSYSPEELAAAAAQATSGAFPAATSGAVPSVSGSGSFARAFGPASAPPGPSLPPPMPLAPPPSSALHRTIAVLLAVLVVAAGVVVFLMLRRPAPSPPTPAAATAPPPEALPSVQTAHADASTEPAPSATPSAFASAVPSAPVKGRGKGQPSGRTPTCEYQPYYDSSGTRQYREVCK